MPRKGYHSLTLPESDYRRLLELAKAYGTTPQNIVKIAISDEKFTIRKPLHGGGRRFESDSAHHRTFFVRVKEALPRKTLLQQPRNVYGTPGPKCTVQLDEFLKFCRVDLGLAARTVERNKYAITRVLNACGPDPARAQLRDFLAQIENPSTKDNYVKAMRAYFRDFLGSDVASTFRLSCPAPPPVWCPSRKMVQEFYHALENGKERAHPHPHSHPHPRARPRP